MKTFYFNDVTDFAAHLSETVDGLPPMNDVGIISPADEATTIIESLIKEEFCIGDIQIADVEIGDYYDEYYISLYEGMIFCKPFRDKESDRCCTAEDTIVYISNNCKSTILSNIKTEVVYAYEIKEYGCCCDDCGCHDVDTTSYKVNGKSVDKKTYEKAITDIEEKYLDGIQDMLLRYYKFQKEIDEWRKMFL